MLKITRHLLDLTYQQLRTCGSGRTECQVLWVSNWAQPAHVTSVIHPTHGAHAGGFHLDDQWLHRFWLELSYRNEGIRAQIHTHPGAAFHSEIDDAFPIVHSAGFLSLVIPSFARGGANLEGAFLAERTSEGEWREVPVKRHITVLDD